LGRYQIGALEIVEHNVPPTDLKKVKRKDLARHIDAIYRLKPDRRFVHAVSEVQVLLGGRQETATVSRLDNGGWAVQLGETEVGQLPDLPTFSDGLAFVRRWASQEVGRHLSAGGPRARPSDVAELQARAWRGSYLEHLQAMRRINILAKKAPHDPNLLGLAANNLLVVAVDTDDAIEILDPLLGRAMALLALSEAASGPVDVKSLSVLASRLGYWGDAYQLASALPPMDPWRLFLDRDASQLRALLEKDRDPFLANLTIRAFAARADTTGALAAADLAGLADPPSFTLLAALASMEGFSMEPTIDENLAAEAFRLVVDTRLPEGDPAHPTLAQRVRRLWQKLRRHASPMRPVQARLLEFETAVRRQTERLAGPLEDRVAVAAALRAPLYAALSHEATYCLDRLSSTSGAASLAASVVDPPAGTGADLKRWIEDRVAANEGRPGVGEQLARNIGTLRHIGYWPLEHLVWAQRRSTKVWWDPTLRRPIRGLLDQMDTRPKFLAAASNVVASILFEHKRAERWIVAAEQAAPGRLPQPQFAFVISNVKDPDTLRSLAARPDLPEWNRGTALVHLARREPDASADVVRQLKRLSDQVGPESSVTFLEDVVGVLDRLGHTEEADREIDQWLETPGPSAGLAYYDTLQWKVYRLRHRGKPAEAWKLIEPALESCYNGVFVQATLTLLDLKKPEQALEIATTAAKRYPDSGVDHGLIAQALWRLDRAAEAARYLKTALEQRWGSAWSDDVALAFVREFPSPDFEHADRAFEELRKAGVSDQSLRDLAIGISDKGNHRLSFRFLSALLSTGSEKETTLLSAFKELRQMDGPDAALAWLHSEMPMLTDGTIIQAYRIGADDIVWDYPGQPSTQNKSPLWMLLRAAAYVRSKNPKPAQREGILEYCRRQPANSWASLYPRYLLGEVDEDAVLPFAKGESDICTVGWLIATRKAGEGKVAEANDWFEVAMETGQERLPPYGLSYELMSKWPKPGTFVQDQDEPKRTK
jgi:tetratricopeptide (TPR) repeat protein